MDRPYGFSGFLYRSNGAKEAITITVGVPEEAPDQSYFCEIRTRLLPTDPYRVYSRLKNDAWAKAFELLHNALKHTDGVLLNGKGEQVELPSPPRDRSWVGPPTVPNIERVEPIYRIEGWAKDHAGERRRVELAVWPPFEEEPGTFCAPMRCGLRRGGEVICSYGATPAQAVQLAYKYLQIEVECRPVTDDDGRPIDIPIPPEPPLLDDEIH